MPWPSSATLIKSPLFAFGIAPLLLGMGGGLLLNWTSVVWLTDAGGFWPVTAILLSIAFSVRRAFGPFAERISALFAWVVITWTWFHAPLWWQATEVAQSSAIVTDDGRVYRVADAARQPSDKIWWLTGKLGSRVVRNVKGTQTIASVDVGFEFERDFIAGRRDGEDLTALLVSAVEPILAAEALNPRGRRAALFDGRQAESSLARRVCRRIDDRRSKCPVALRFKPTGEASLPGGLWSERFSEQEAIAERHLPTLAQLLLADGPQVVAKDDVFAAFLALGPPSETLARVARHPRRLGDTQLAVVVERILSLAGAGDDVVKLLIEGVRLSTEQRRRLRTKVLEEADAGLIVRNAARLHFADDELALMSGRLIAACKRDPELAQLALQAWGERLPADVAREAVRTVEMGPAIHAVRLLGSVLPVEARASVFAKALVDAGPEDFTSAKSTKDGLSDTLGQNEMRTLISAIVERSKTSTKWLEFAVRSVPPREMSPAQQRVIIDGLLFESAKVALEFVSENRRELQAADVEDVTHIYVRTITPDFCLHLSHRNRNRRVDYFSARQVDIFSACANSSRVEPTAAVQSLDHKMDAALTSASR